MALNTKHVYSNKFYAHLTAAISASATTLSFYPGEITSLLAGWQAGSWLYLCIMDLTGSREIIKVTGLSGSTLTIERGQGGTTARVWGVGSLVSSRVTAEYLDRFLQKGVNRSGAYNPNTVLTGEFTGEKYYQTGPDATQRRWWMNTTGDKWRLLTGDIYGFEWTDVDGYILTPNSVHSFGGSSGSAIQDNDQYTPYTDTWASKTDIPTPARMYMAAFAVSLTAFTCGGSTNSARVQTCESYLFDAWTAKTAMPSPARYTHAAAPLSTKGYSFGGSNNGVTELTDCDEYDTEADSWASKTNIPIGLMAFSACAISDKAYTFGGVGSGVVPINKPTYEYTPDAWTEKTDHPLPHRGSSAAFCLNSKGYLAGGYDSDNGVLTDDLDEYVSDTWTGRTDMPAPIRYSHAACAPDDIGYIYGGWDDSSNRIQDTDAYDPATDTWTSKSDMPAPGRVGHAGACSNSG